MMVRDLNCFIWLSCFVLVVTAQVSANVGGHTLQGQRWQSDTRLCQAVRSSCHPRMAAPRPQSASHLVLHGQARSCSRIHIDPTIRLPRSNSDGMSFKCRAMVSPDHENQQFGDDLQNNMNRFAETPGIEMQEQMLQMLSKPFHLAASSIISGPKPELPDGDEMMLWPDAIKGHRVRIAWRLAPDHSYAVLVVGPSGSKGKRFRESHSLPKEADEGHFHVKGTQVRFSDMQHALEENMYISVNALAVPSPFLLIEQRNAKDFMAIKGFVKRMFNSSVFQDRFKRGDHSIPVYVVALTPEAITPTIKAHIAVARYLKKKAGSSQGKEPIVPVVSALIHDVVQSEDDQYHVSAYLYMQPLRPNEDELDPVWKRTAGAFMSVLQKARSNRIHLWLMYQASHVSLFFLHPILGLFSKLHPFLDASNSMCDLLKFLYLVSIAQTILGLVQKLLTADPILSLSEEETLAYEEARESAHSELNTFDALHPKDVLNCKELRRRKQQLQLSRLSLYLALMDNLFPAIDTIQNHAVTHALNAVQSLIH